MHMLGDARQRSDVLTLAQVVHGSWLLPAGGSAASRQRRSAPVEPASLARGRQGAAIDAACTQASGSVLLVLRIRKAEVSSYQLIGILRASRQRRQTHQKAQVKFNERRAVVSSLPFVLSSLPLP